MHGSSHVRRTKKSGDRRASVGGASIEGRKEKRRREWTLRTLVAKYGGKCALCGEPVHARGDEADPEAATFDHIVPKSRGGSDAIANLQLAHYRCNQAKGDGL